MKVERFEDIIAWQKAKQLTIGTYKAFSNCRDFPFRDQVQRAAVSIMNNIAEGYERQSNKEFRQFLYMAKGSAGEVRSMLDLALELKYIPPKVHTKLYEVSVEISKLLSGFIKTL